MKLRVSKCELREANAFVEMFHRHNGRVTQHRFSCCVEDEGGGCHGVGTAGNPVSRMLMQTEPGTIEILRVCTRGTRNACTMLYGSLRRAAHAIGWRRVITYTLEKESGASLRAAGFTLVGPAGGGSWESREATEDRRERQERHRPEVAVGERT